MLGVSRCFVGWGSCKSNSKPRDFEDLGLFQHFTFLGQKRSSFPKHSPTNDHKPAPANYSPTVLGVDEEAWRKMINIYNQTKGWLSAVII